MKVTKLAGVVIGALAVLAMAEPAAEGEKGDEAKVCTSGAKPVSRMPYILSKTTMLPPSLRGYGPPWRRNARCEPGLMGCFDAFTIAKCAEDGFWQKDVQCSCEGCTVATEHGRFQDPNTGALWGARNAVCICKPTDLDADKPLLQAPHKLELKRETKSVCLSVRSPIPQTEEGTYCSRPDDQRCDKDNDWTEYCTPNFRWSGIDSCYKHYGWCVASPTPHCEYNITTGGPCEADGLTQCDKNDWLYDCSNGKWQVTDNCRNTSIVGTGIGYCATLPVAHREVNSTSHFNCTEGHLTCIDGDSYICRGNQWVERQPCHRGSGKCVDGLCIGGREDEELQAVSTAPAFGTLFTLLKRASTSEPRTYSRVTHSYAGTSKAPQIPAASFLQESVQTFQKVINTAMPTRDV